ncbi:unnamed protein product [Porites evermanni]|uniref:VWFA domain-containing protein n=1 Tax=Porites evermanni TaxID=104178 RepID=A0ABN8S0K5_9CNID|nr:unnamed protein product [Porites evermanni]
MDTARRLAKNLPFLRRSQSSSNNPFSRLPSRSRPAGSTQTAEVKSDSWSGDLGSPLYDVVFIIDESGSIPLHQFKKGLSAIRLLIGDALLGTKFAAIKFSSKAHLLFNFVSPDQAKKKLLNVGQNGGMTNTQDALKMARRDLFLNAAASGHRQNAHRMAVVVTDGLSNIQRDQTLPQAIQLKGIGTRVMVIAVGNYGDSGHKEMRGIASHPPGENLFFAGDFDDMYQITYMAINGI